MTIQNTSITKKSNLPNLSNEILLGHSDLVSEIIEKYPEINNVEDCLRCIAALGLGSFEDKMALLDEKALEKH